MTRQRGKKGERYATTLAEQTARVDAIAARVRANERARRMRNGDDSCAGVVTSPPVTFVTPVVTSKGRHYAPAAVTMHACKTLGPHPERNRSLTACSHVWPGQATQGNVATHLDHVTCGNCLRIVRVFRRDGGIRRP